MFKHQLILGWIFISILGMSCIGDDFTEDFVTPEIRITNAIDTLEIGTSYQLETDAFNNVGNLDDRLSVEWTSAQPEVISVTSEGLATAEALGTATLTATTSTTDGTFTQDIDIVVGQSTTASVSVDGKKGVIATTTFYELEGDFTLVENGEALLLSIADNYKATSALPGLYLYLSNNPRSIAGAHEVGEVKVFSGAHQYQISDVGIDDFKYLLYFCEPFNVKVGDGEIVDAE